LACGAPAAAGAAEASPVLAGPTGLPWEAAKTTSMASRSGGCLGIDEEVLVKDGEAPGGRGEQALGVDRGAPLVEVGALGSDGVGCAFMSGGGLSIDEEAQAIEGNGALNADGDVPFDEIVAGGIEEDAPAEAGTAAGPTTRPPYISLKAATSSAKAAASKAMTGGDVNRDDEAHGGVVSGGAMVALAAAGATKAGSTQPGPAGFHERHLSINKAWDPSGLPTSWKEVGVAVAVQAEARAAQAGPAEPRPAGVSSFVSTKYLLREEPGNDGENAEGVDRGAPHDEVAALSNEGGVVSGGARGAPVAAGAAAGSSQPWPAGVPNSACPSTRRGTLRPVDVLEGGRLREAAPAEPGAAKAGPAKPVPAAVSSLMSTKYLSKEGPGTDGEKA
jgi:hypothetical protein